MRRALPDRWERFHALRGAKRSAGTAAERTGVLARGRAIAGAVLGAGARLCVTGQVTWADALVVPLEWRDGDKVTRFQALRVMRGADGLLTETACAGGSPARTVFWLVIR